MMNRFDALVTLAAAYINANGDREDYKMELPVLEKESG